MDFSNLNKAYPNEFPLLRIDSLVDSTSGHALLSFIESFSRYNQIRMKKEDQEKMLFITD